MDIENFVLNPATLLVIVFGLVEFIKSFGLNGNKLKIISMVTGILLAAIFKASTLLPQYQTYIDLAFFSITVGLAASGVYDFLNQRIPKRES